MDLLRHWRRRTFGAAIGALIAPAAIVAAALAVGVGGGGLGGLQSIGQAVNGPDLPDVSPSAARGPADSAGRLLARVQRRERRAARAGAAPATAAPTTAAGTPVASAPTPGTGPQGDGGGQQPAGTPPPAGTPQPPAATPTQPPPTTAPAATPTQAPTQPPSPLRQVGDGVKQITDQVPVAGQPVGGVVDLLVDTVDGLNPR